MKSFKDLEHKEVHGGTQAKMTFDNGYGVSVIRTTFSYGSSEGLYELAVLGENGGLDYSTSITNDVLGHMTEAEVADTMEAVQMLDNVQ